MLTKASQCVVTGSTKAFHQDFAGLPKVDGAEQVNVTVRLRRRNTLPRPGDKHISHRHFAARFGADPAGLAQLEGFAAACDLRIVRSRSRHVVLRGSARSMQKAFSTELRLAKMNGRTFRVRQGPLSVPAKVAPFIVSVTGLDNRPFAKPHYRISQKAHAVAAGSSLAASAATAVPTPAFTPAEVASLYNFPAAFDGAGQKIAILELDGGFRPEELATYFRDLDLVTPKVTVVSFPGCGGNNPGANALDPFCRDAEVMLDLQIAGGMAPGAELLVYFASDDSDDGFLSVMSAIVHDSVNRPDVISISWGGPESTGTGQFRQAFDELLQSSAHLGITVCAATGDNAAPDFDAEDPRWDHNSHVDFPACSPWALAVGGTRIAVAGNAIAHEEVWFDEAHIGAGGGISRCFALPDYQSNAGISRAMNPEGPAMRGVPDVAANSAPASGFRILCNGQRFPDPDKSVPAMGGTSAAAPLWAALVAQLNQALGRRCGFLNPALYQLAALDRDSIFRNSASGTNGTYFAGAGWNACTGLGSVDGTKLLEALRRMQV